MLRGPLAIILSTVLMATFCAATAQEVAVPTPATTVVLEIPQGAEAGPGFDAETATQAYVDLIDRQERAKTADYVDGGYWLELWGLVYGLGIAWLLLGTRLSARMRDRAERISRRRPIQTALYAAQYIVVSTILLFPLTVYQGFFREHRYGLATQGFGGWMGDQATGLAVSVVLGSLLLVLVYGVIRRMPQRWWLGGAGVAVAFLTFLITISPVFIAPLFNDYRPLDEGPIRDSILSLARANGVPADDVYWVDASRQTNRISASVSGMFGTTRITLNDNLLTRSSPAEIEAVMAHEMGHYLLGHRGRFIVYFGLIFVAGFAFVKWGFDKALARWGVRWQIRDVRDTAGLPLLVGLLSIYLFLATPVMNNVIRIAELEADIFALNASRQPDGFARVALRISDYRKLEPGRLEEILLNDHPSGRTRVYESMRWKAENLDLSPGRSQR
jgi:STE24 endopeptidase